MRRLPNLDLESLLKFLPGREAAGRTIDLRIPSRRQFGTRADACEVVRSAIDHVDREIELLSRNDRLVRFHHVDNEAGRQSNCFVKIRLFEVEKKLNLFVCSLCFDGIE